MLRSLVGSEMCIRDSRLSVCPSVTRRYCVKTTARSTVQFALSDSKMCLVLQKPKYIPERRPLPPEILAQTDPPSPESSEVSHVLPCSASTVRASEKSSIMTNRKSYTGFPTSHQPRFYAAPNFLKIGIKMPGFIVFWATSTIKDKKFFAAKFHYIKTVSGKVVAQSIAFRVVSIYWQGRPLHPEILPPSDLPCRSLAGELSLSCARPAADG